MAFKTHPTRSVKSPLSSRRCIKGASYRLSPVMAHPLHPSRNQQGLQVLSTSENQAPCKKNGLVGQCTDLAY